MSVELIKAGIVPLVLSAAAFIFARMAFGSVISPGRIDRWRNVYLAVTFVSFFVPNYWVVLGVLTIVVLAMGATEKFRPALYLLLLFAIPAAGETVPGIGGINNFLYLYPFNILAIIILYPVLLVPTEKRVKSPVGGLADLCFFGYSALCLALAFRDTSFTDGIRRSTEYLLTAVPQYLVFSRLNWSAERIRVATAALVFPFFALAAVGVAELVLHWHFYEVAISNWNTHFHARYLGRSGLLRAYGTVFGPIAFGLFLAMALPLSISLMSSVKSKNLPRLGVAGIGAGLLATLSRGPWVGGVGALAMFALTSRAAFSNMFKLGVAGVISLALLSLTPFGRGFIDLLPGIGSVNRDTIDYRQQLWDVGVEVAMQHPLFGSENYRQAPEMQVLVQGQGIIDIVNSYLTIMLDSGLVGLTLFVSALGFSIIALWSRLGIARRLAPDVAPYAQGYIAALAGVMIVLATTSSLAQVREAVWVLAGTCIGIARYLDILSRKGAGETAAAASPTDADLGPPEPPPEAPMPPADKVPAHLRQYLKR